MEKRAESSICRIALIGPESSGKTTLAQQLAQRFNTVWVPEYARKYIAELDREYTLEDVMHIAQQQLQMEREMLCQANGFIFADTELIIAKVWCEDVFNCTPAWIEEQLPSTTYDLYLLTDLDLPWMPDPVRENPHRREYFFRLYKEHLDEMSLPYVIIRGSDDARLENAVNAIKSFFSAQ